MPKSVTRYDLLISCPGDITEEVKIIQEAVEKFNEQFSDTLGISIRARHWSKSAYAQSGGKPQALLNEQFVNHCDAAVAIFWTRFGTPTDEYGSGTEEEIEIMLQSGKQVFMYFAEKPISPTCMNAKEFERVTAFKDKYKSEGIYKTYSTLDEFSKILFADLTMYFMTQKASADTGNIRCSNLLLRGIDENQNLTDSAVIHAFQLRSSNSKEKIRQEIIDHFGKVNALHMGGYVPPKSMFNASSTMLSLYGTPVQIPQGMQDTITAASNALKIAISNDFFNLGNLVEGPRTSLYGGNQYNGSEKEKEKHRLIYRLHELIMKYLDWAEIEDTYPKMSCITLAIENNGTAIDRDIELTLTFPKGAILPVQEFPVLKSDYAWEYLLDKFGIKNLLTIPATSCYAEYMESWIPSQHIHESPYVRPMNPFSSRNYKKEYFDELNSGYLYDIFCKGEYCILKIKFDYIKHHTTVAFPNPIFLKSMPDAIEYSITSQNLPDVISGKLACSLSESKM